MIGCEVGIPPETLELQERDQIRLSKVFRCPCVTVAPLKKSCGATVSEGGHEKRSTQAVKPLANRQAAARGVGTPKFGVCGPRRLQKNKVL